MVRVAAYVLGLALSCLLVVAAARGGGYAPTTLGAAGDSNAARARPGRPGQLKSADRPVPGDDHGPRAETIDPQMARAHRVAARKARLGVDADADADATNAASAASAASASQPAKASGAAAAKKAPAATTAAGKKNDASASASAAEPKRERAPSDVDKLLTLSDDAEARGPDEDVAMLPSATPLPADPHPAHLPGAPTAKEHANILKSDHADNRGPDEDMALIPSATPLPATETTETTEETEETEKPTPDANAEDEAEDETEAQRAAQRAARGRARLAQAEMTDPVEEDAETLDAAEETVDAAAAAPDGSATEISAADDAADAEPEDAPVASPFPAAVPAVPHSAEEVQLFEAEEALRAAANRKAAYEAAFHLARKTAETASAQTSAAHAEFERLNSELREAEKEARQATDDLRDIAAETQTAAERAFEIRMEAATIKAEKKSMAAHAKLDDDQSVARVALHTKQLNFLKLEEERLREKSEEADKHHDAMDSLAKQASLDAINAKTAAKKDGQVGQETTALGQQRAARVAAMSAKSKQAEANLLQAAYRQSDAAAKYAAAQRKVAEEQEALNDELALEKLLAAKSRKAEQDFIDATARHAARETQTTSEGHKQEVELFSAAVMDADHQANYERAKRVADRAQEVAELKYKAEQAANEVAHDLQEKYDIAEAAYEQAKAQVAIAEKRFTQAEDHAFDAERPDGEPVGLIERETLVADTQVTDEIPSSTNYDGSDEFDPDDDA